MSLRHTKVCQVTQSLWIDSYSRVARDYPAHCKKCRGSGIIRYRDDPSAGGVSLSSGSLEYAEPCPECLEKSFCPVCGLPSVIDDPAHDDYSYCPRCGWEEKGSKELYYEYPDCDCGWDREDDLP
jgi:ribosomal protein S27AE